MSVSTLVLLPLVSTGGGVVATGNVRVWSVCAAAGSETVSLVVLSVLVLVSGDLEVDGCTLGCTGRLGKLCAGLLDFNSPKHSCLR